MATLSLRFMDKHLANYQISQGDTLLIGRNKVNDIVIDNLAVSAQHAKIESDGKGFLLVDLKSENGTFVNDQLIKSHWLNDGDIIAIGKHLLKFSDPKYIKQPEKESSSMFKTMQMDTKQFRELMNKNKQEGQSDFLTHASKGPSPEKPVCRLSYLTGSDEDIQLNHALIRIGRGPKADVRIKGFAVGKTAAVINRLSDGWHMSYVGGFSKLRVNSKILRKTVKLNNLDIIAIGKTKLQFLEQ